MKKLFKDKKVTIMGLGLHGGGVGVVKFFCQQGAKVLVTDLKTRKQLKESLNKLKGLKIEYTLGRHEKKDFLWPDLIIKNPDVLNSSPYLEIAKKHKIPIETDIGLFFKHSDAFIIGITGTKGKSTTASLIYQILKQRSKRVFLAGNIGTSPLSLLNRIKKGDKVVLELSSFELEDLKQSPQIAVITNILPDHLNRYATMQEYIEAKKPIFKYQTKKDTLVLNRDDSIVRQFEKDANSKVYFFSAKNLPENINLTNFKLYGNQNLSNLAAAIKVAEVLKIKPGTINGALKDFKGVGSRQEFVKEISGVKYFNDTTATIPEAVVFAIDSFSEKFPKANLFIICGGVHKGVDYRQMAKRVKEKNVDLIILPGSASEKIRGVLPEYKKITDASSMQDAVKTASQLAKAGDIVILSPAASSFNVFKNEFDRGKQFVQALKNLK